MRKVDCQRWSPSEVSEITRVTSEEGRPGIQSEIDESVISMFEWQGDGRLLIRNIREHDIWRLIKHEFFIGGDERGAIRPILRIRTGIHRENEIHIPFMLK